MGFEHVASSVYIDTSLLPNTDLTDPRIPRAFNSWLRFKQANSGQILNISQLTTDQVSDMGQALSGSIEEAVGLARVGTGKGIALSRRNLGAVLEYLAADQKTKTVFMRHGEQSPPEWISTIEDPTIRKIRMMQNPFNKDDCLTNRGFVDVFATAFGLLYLQQASGRNLHILSSKNRRAQEVAGVISNMVPQATFTSLEGLDSISYKDETDDPAFTLEHLIDQLPPGGHMPWDPELVNRLCKPVRSGQQCAEVIVETVEALLHSSDQPDNDLFLALTHSQQLAEVLRVRRNLPDPTIRYPELTMIAVESSKVHVFPRGILETAAPGSIGG